MLTDIGHALLGSESIQVLLVAALAVTLLGGHWRDQRPALRGTLVLLASGMLVQVVGILLLRAEVISLGNGLHDLGHLINGIAVIRLFALALFRAVLPSLKITLPRIVEDVVVVIAYLAWGLIQLRLAGVDPSSLVTSSAVITAVIAFSMQDTLGNALGGLFLELDESLALGDWVNIDDISGRVEQIRWRHTAIRTRNGEIVIVPNSTLMRTRFKVLGNPAVESTRIRRWIWFDTRTVTPSHVLSTAEKFLAVAEIANVARDPPPNCVLMEMTAGYCRYALRYWLIDPGPDDATDTAVRLHLYTALQRAGIEFGSPQQVIRRIDETPDREEAKHKLELAHRRAALAHVDIFSTLSASELDALAARLVYAPFAASDVVTRQGAVAHWLYLLDAGEADVYVEEGQSPRRHIASLHGGNFFGEMGLLTGAPRRATIVARTDLECYRLDKASFEDILHARPELAEHMSHLLLSRNKDLNDIVAAAGATHEQPAPATPDTLMTHIRTFFGLGE